MTTNDTYMYVLVHKLNSISRTLTIEQLTVNSDNDQLPALLTRPYYYRVLNPLPIVFRSV